MANAQFSADFSGAGIIPEEDDLRIRVDALPTAERVSLDQVNVPSEGLRGGKKSDHRSRTSTSEFS
jgi:hypothetical protein